MTTGIIYKATSPSNKVYIGQTIKRLSKRRGDHFSNAFNKNRAGYNNKFYNAVRKYGDELKWEILYDNIPVHRLNGMEIVIIAWYDSYKRGYNSTLGGGGNVGYKHTDETKKKISRAGKGRRHSEEAKRKMSEIGLGKKKPSLAGDKHPRAKLTWEEVREIRAKYLPHEYSLLRLAKEYSISKANAGKIVSHKSWVE